MAYWRHGGFYFGGWILAELPEIPWISHQHGSADAPRILHVSLHAPCSSGTGLESFTDATAAAQIELMLDSA